ncbi:fimbria/pilus periplasmic chaperone [Pseudocitrobacter sp. Cyp-38S]|uniref:Fimbria/pilus periplasmic chaperone n=1 Tax=Pseudocitrobacter cyperus TaxID=3112843 RepID=A0ABV0HI44_9ENTR
MALLLLCALPARAGVVIGGTRFVYRQEQHALNVPLRNASDSAWLVVTRVQSAARWPGARVTAAEAFVVVPPICVLAGGQENTLRLIRTASPLPTDRESLFTLSVATVPSGKVDGNRVQMGVRSALKLIYRPSGLAGEPQQAYRQLRWSAGRGLSVSNPTPYYVTLFNLSINGKTLDNPGVVAPFSTRSLSRELPGKVIQLRWQTLNDYGRVMPPITAHPLRVP